MATFDFSVSLLDGCLNDELTATGSIDDVTYFIAQTGLLPIPTPEYSQSLLNCPIDWTLVVVDDLG